MSDREEELKRVLGENSAPGPAQKQPLLGKKKWYANKRNWGFWLLMGAFVVFLVSNYIIRPWVS